MVHLSLMTSLTSHFMYDDITDVTFNVYDITDVTFNLR